MSPRASRFTAAAVIGLAGVGAAVIWWNSRDVSDGHTQSGANVQQTTASPSGDSIDPRLFAPASGVRSLPTQSIYGPVDPAKIPMTAIDPHLEYLDSQATKPPTQEGKSSNAEPR